MDMLGLVEPGLAAQDRNGSRLAELLQVAKRHGRIGWTVNARCSAELPVFIAPTWSTTGFTRPEPPVASA